MIVIQDKALLIQTEAPDLITSQISKSHQTKNGDVLVHWGFDETQTLRSLGFLPPSPIMKEYHWPGQFKPFDHQREIAKFLTSNQRAFNFSEQGTGKTASAAWAADYLMTKGVIRRCLIICPVSIMDSAWRADLFSTVMHRTVDIAYGTPTKRRKILDNFTDFVIINYEGVGIVEEEIFKGKFDLIIVDEANAYKNPSTNRWKALRRVLHPHCWLWMMTGTPAAQSPEDAYGLGKLVSPDRVSRTKSAWKDKVMTRVSQWKWVPRRSSQDIVHAALQPAIRYTKEQCLDLPDQLYTKRNVEMTPQQQKYYKEMKDQMLIQTDGEEVTSANAAVNLSKLLQISTGSVFTDQGEIIDFDISNRMTVLKEVMAEASKKVLIFAQYKHIITRLAEELNKREVKTAIINGDVSQGKRTEIIREFQDPDSPLQVLVIQPQAAAHGVTLTAADTIVWWGPTSSLELYEQANARVHRAGQTHKTTVVQLQGSPAERHLYRMLDDRINIHGSIMELYKELVN